MSFTDPATGRAYEIIDWRFVGGKRKRVALGMSGSEGRAFVPVDGSSVLLYEYKRFVDYRDAEPRTLARQFAEAVPAGSTSLERLRMQGYAIDINSRKHGRKD